MLDQTLDLSPLRSQFPALQQIAEKGSPSVYFDGPGGTQVPQVVIDAMADYLINANANCGGPFITSNRNDDMIIQARIAMADFLNAGSEREIVFGSYILAEAGSVITETTVQMFKQSFATVSQDVTKIGSKGDDLAEGIVNVCLFIPDTISLMKMTAREIVRSPKEILVIVLKDLNEIVLTTNEVFSTSIIEREQWLEKRAGQGYGKIIGFSRFIFRPF